MSVHPNAHILKRLAEIAQTTDKPWEHFERMRKDLNVWVLCSEHTEFLNTDFEFRERIFNPIEINGTTLEGPLRKAPEYGSHYWILLDSDTDDAKFTWRDDLSDEKWLAQDRVFRTREARDAVQAEIAKILKGEG